MRGFVITLVVLLALLVGADFALKTVAEDQVASRLQKPLDLPTEPSVDIGGFPFPPQAIAGRYSDVELSDSGITYGRLRNVTLTAQLEGVTLPLQSLIDRQVDAIPTRTVVASGRVAPEDLARVLDVSDVTVTAVTQADLDQLASAAEGDSSGASGNASTLKSIDPSNAVQLTSTTTVLGQELKVAVIATFRVAGGQISLAARDIRVDGSSGGTLGRLAGSALRSRLAGYSVQVDPGKLPFSITATDVHADNGDLVVSGTAQDVDLLSGTS